MTIRFALKAAVAIAALSHISAPEFVRAAEAASPPEAGQLPPYVLERSAMLQIRAPSGDAYDVMVAWPEGPPPPNGWPVLYVLDGEDNFPVTVLTARRLARQGAQRSIPEGLVVGLAAGPLPRRVWDYTPPTPGYSIPKGLPAAGLETGGAERFLDLLADRIMPAVRERWPVDTGRETIVGHSFGGLLAIHAALTRADMLDGAVAISPSLWFGGDLLDRDLAARQQHSGSHARLLVMREEKRRTASRPGLQSGDNLVQRLNAITSKDSATFRPLPGAKHGTSFLAALVPAIRFAFNRDEKREDTKACKPAC